MGFFIGEFLVNVLCKEALVEMYTGCWQQRTFYVCFFFFKSKFKGVLHFKIIFTAHKAAA